MNILVKCPSVMSTAARVTNFMNLGAVRMQYICLTKGTVLKQNVIPLVTKARLASSTSSSSSSRAAEKLRIKDGVPPGYELVYRVPVNSYIIACQNVCSICSAFLIAVSAYRYIRGDFSAESPVLPGFGSMDLSHEQLLTLIGAFVIVSVTLQIFVTKLPLRIYRSNTDSFRAVYTGLVPMQTRHVEFKAGSVVRVPVSDSAFLPWSVSWFRINGKKNIILEQYFRKPVDLHSMLQEKKTE